MTNRLALYLGGIIVVALGVDMIFFDWYYSIFWGKRLAELIEYIAFWR